MSFPAITLVTTSTGPSMITLPSITTIDELGQRVAGTSYVIRDRDGSANIYPITIQSGSNSFGTPQYFTSGTNSNQSFQITQPYGFATITEQSHYTYRIESASTYPQGATDIFTQQLTISTGTVVPNLVVQDTQNPNAQYGLFVSTGSLLFQTLNSDTQSISSVIQVTSAQYISTFSSFANIFESSSIYTSSFLTKYISTRYVIGSTIISSNAPIIGTITNQTGQICTANISANTVDTKNILSSLNISSGLISALQGFVSTMNLSNINTNFFSVLTQSYIQTGLASNISAGIGNITSNAFAYHVSTDRFYMSSLTSEPSFRNHAHVSSVNAMDIQSIEASISTISTNWMATQTIHDSKVLTTNTLSANEISTNTVTSSALSNSSTIYVSTLFIQSTNTSSFTINTLFTSTISSGIVSVAQLSPSTILFNTISTNTVDQGQIISTGQLFGNVASTPSTFVNHIARVSTLSTDNLSTSYVSANNAFISSLSTSEIFINRLSTPNVNFQSLSVNTISTARMYADFAGVRSTIASTISTTFLVTSTLTNSLISSLFTDYISTRTLAPSTLSTIQTDSFIFQPSTCVNVASISSRFVALNILSTVLINPPLQGQTEYDQLSAGTMYVGTLQASTIRTTGMNPISSCVTYASNYIIPDNPNSSITLYYLSTPTSSFTLNQSMVYNDQPMLDNIKFVIGGDGNASRRTYATGTITTSASWSQTTIPINGQIRGISYARKTNTWLAVGYGTSINSTMAISYNGVNWSTIANNGLVSGTGVGGDAAAYSEDQNLWVVVGSQGRIVTSGDGGATWVLRTNTFNTATGEIGLCIAYSPQQKLWVAGGNSLGSTGFASIQTSPNGINWTMRMSGTGIQKVSHAIAYSARQNLWVSIGYSSQTCITSPDAMTWTQRNILIGTGFGIAFSEKQNMWVAVGSSGIQRSLDAFTWEAPIANPAGAGVHDVTYNPELNIWIAVAINGWYGYSSDGISWSQIGTAGTAGYAVATSFANPTFTSQYLNMDLTSTSVSATANSLNRFVAYNSTLVLNSTIFMQQVPNEVGINTANPIADLDVNSTINAPLFSTLTINTRNVNPGDLYRFSTILTDQVSTQQTFAMRGLFDSFSTGFISSRLVTVSTITNDALIGRQMNVNQISSGLYEGGLYSIAGISTFSISTGTTTSFTVSTGVVSSENYVHSALQTDSMFVAAGASNSVLKVSYNGASWLTITPIPAALSASDNRLFTQSIPMYNSNGNFWVIPTKLIAGVNTRGPLYTTDFINFSTLNVPRLPPVPTNGTENFTRSYVAAPGIQVIGCALVAANAATNSTIYYKLDNSPIGAFTPVPNSGTLISFINQLIYTPVVGGIFLGVGGGGQNIIRSVNGITWAAVGLGFNTYGSAIAYNGSYWVAVGNSAVGSVKNCMQYSLVPGTTWKTVNQTQWTNILEPRWIVYGNGLWVVGGDAQSGQTCIKITNNDLSALTTVTFSNTRVNGALIDNTLFTRCTNIMWNGTFFTALCTPVNLASSSALISTDGSNWSYGDPGEPFPTATFGGFAYGNSGPNTTALTLQVRRNAQISSLSTTFVSTFSVTSQEFQASTVSSILLSSVIGFFSTLGVPSETTTYNLNTTTLNATTGFFSNGTLAPSDSNIKTNIELADLTQCFQTMESMPLKKFTYKPEYSEGIQDQTQLGFIAQEVQSVFPKSIFPISTDDGSQTILHVTFDQLFMTSYGATQQLMSIVEERQSTITSLYSSVESLQNQISTLKGNNV